MISWTSWGFNCTTQGPPGTALHLQELCFGVGDFCLFWSFGWLVFILLGWFFGEFFGGEGGGAVFKGEIKLNSAKMICKGGGVTNSPCQPLQQHRQKRGKDGGILPKSGLYSLIGELPKKTPSPNHTNPLGPFCPAPSALGYRGSAAPPAPEPPVAAAVPLATRPGQGTTREGKGGQRSVVAREQPSQAEETPGLVVFVCFHFK